MHLTLQVVLHKVYFEMKIEMWYSLIPGLLTNITWQNVAITVQKLCYHILEYAK